MVTELANAKVNLYLDVVSRRPDGFHNIKTVMHSVSLFDTLTVSAVEDGVTSLTLEVVGTPELAGENNLAARAAYAYLSAAGISARVHIRLEKNIPIAAGLAGGSTDAAAVLRALNRSFGFPLTAAELSSIAATLGSDVPFCLLGGTVLCEGRGEVMRPIHAPRPMNFVIAVAEESVSTPAAYSALDSLYSDFDGSVPHGGAMEYDALSAFLAGAPLPDKLYNVFEDAVLPECNGAREIKAAMLRFGAVAALMSGSGPSVFGIFEDADVAEECRNKLVGLGYRAYVAHSV